MFKCLTPGMLFIMAVEDISWISVGQTLIALMIVEVEYMACFKTIIHAFGCTFVIRPIMLLCDNSAAVSFWWESHFCCVHACYNMVAEPLIKASLKICLRSICLYMSV